MVGVKREWFGETEVSWLATNGSGSGDLRPAHDGGGPP